MKTILGSINIFSKRLYYMIYIYYIKDIIKLYYISCIDIHDLNLTFIYIKHNTYIHT